jgi:2-iminobutanoate/2-iminopropanoate deaminase
MSKTAVESAQAPKPIGPYAQAVVSGDLFFASGQIGLDPATNRLVDGGVETQTERALANLDAVLGAAGLAVKDVVRTTIYLADMADFQKVNAIYGRFFAASPPARSTIQVAALPLGARVEIDLIARR